MNGFRTSSRPGGRPPGESSQPYAANGWKISRPIRRRTLRALLRKYWPFSPRTASVDRTAQRIEPDRERKVTKIEKDLKQGRLDDLKTSANGIILGKGLAEKLGIRMNKIVTAVSPEGVIMKMKVVGIFHTA